MLSRDAFKYAFREAVAAEFANIPKNEYSINYTFSEKCNKKMKRLIEAQSRPYWSFFNTAAKRAAAVAIAVVTMVSSAFSVKAVREPIVGFIAKTYEKFTEIVFDNADYEFELKKCETRYVPAGFELIRKTEFNSVYEEKYRSASGAEITYAQYKNKSLRMTIDTEGTNYREIEINGLGGIAYRKNTNNFIMINPEKYTFCVYGEIGEEELIKMAELIEYNTD